MLNGSGAAAELLHRTLNGGIEFYIPHPKQLPFHASPARERWYFTGNRFGKTYSCIAEDVWLISKTHPFHVPISERDPASPFWASFAYSEPWQKFVRKNGGNWDVSIESRSDYVPWDGKSLPKPWNFEYIQPFSDRFVRGRILSQNEQTIEGNIVPTLQSLIPPRWLRGGSWKKAYNREFHILYLNEDFGESMIEMMTYSQTIQAGEGRTCHFIHFDEQPETEKIYDAQIMRTASVKRARIMGSMTPFEPHGWIVQRLWEDAEDNNDLDVFTGHILDSPYVDVETVEFLKSRYNDPVELEARMSGAFAYYSGRALPAYGTAHFQPLPSGGFPPSWPRTLAIDPHPNKPDYWAVGAWDTRNPLYPILHVYKCGTAKGTVEQRCHEIVGSTKDDNVRAVVIDPRTLYSDESRGADTKLKDYRKHFPHIIFPRGSFDDRFNALLKMVSLSPVGGEPRLFVYHECSDAHKQLLHVHWKPDHHSGEERKKADLINKNIDYFDVISYMVHFGPPELEDYVPKTASLFDSLDIKEYHYGAQVIYD